MKNNKIKILLIDDNPFCKSTQSRDVAVNDMLSKMFDIDESLISTINVYDFGFPVFNLNLTGKNKGFLDFFELKWLYSTATLKEFFDLTNYYENILGSEELNKSGYVPDIVVFDYAISGNEANPPKGYNYQFIRKKLDPAFSMRRMLKEKQSNFEYSNYQEWPEKEKNQDRFGLYTGGIIVERFRHNTPCFGIPATYWETVKLKPTEAGFFEWFLGNAFRDVFNNSAIKGKTEEKKDWQVIINVAMGEYRKSIVELIKLNRISVDVQNLISLLNGDFISRDDDNERKLSTFTFKTIYGKRELPLDGLFIDCDIENTEPIPNDLKKILLNKEFISKREKEIWEFVNSLVSALIEAAKIGISMKEIIDAKNIGESLWECYLNDFEERIYISDYECRNNKNLLKEEDDFKRLKDLRSRFQVANGLITNEKSIETIKSDRPQITRLAILYTVTKAYIQMEKQAFRSGRNMKYTELTEEEYFYILNPVANSGGNYNLILPMHTENDTEAGKALGKFKKNISYHLKETEPKVTTSNILKFNEWISTGEKMILKSFFQDDLNILPYWLK